MFHATNLIRIACLSVAIAGVLATSGCGGGQPAPEQAMIGQWTMDKGETEKTNPLMAAMPGGMWYEFKEGGAYAERLSNDNLGSRKKGTWKQVTKEGHVVRVELSREGAESQIVDIAVLGKDHMTINYPEGLGAIHLKRTLADVIEKESPPVGTTQIPRDSIDIGMKRIAHVRVTPDGKLAMVSTYPTGNVKYNFQIWDLQKKEKTAGVDDSYEPVALSPDGKKIGTERGIEDLKGKQLVELDGGKDCYFSPKWDLAVISSVGDISIYELTKGKKVREWKADKSDEFAQLKLAVAWEGDKKIVSGHEDGSVRVWSFNGELLQTLSGGHAKSSVPVRVAISPDGKSVASSGGVAIKIWDLASSKVVKTIDGPWPRQMWFLADGKALLYPDKDTVILENLESGSKRIFPAQIDGLVPAVDLTPDGKVLVTCSKDGVLKIWDIQAP